MPAITTTATAASASDTRRSTVRRMSMNVIGSRPPDQLRGPGRQAVVAEHRAPVPVDRLDRPPERGQLGLRRLDELDARTGDRRQIVLLMHLDHGGRAVAVHTVACV